MRKINLNQFHVATSVTARDINRRIILNVVRTRQPISRADVARATGLQRSTVSLIADQLIEEGWISEGAVGRLPRGRRPIFLQMNTERTRIMGINVRPTTTTLGVANINGEFLTQETFVTAPDPKQFLKELVQKTKSIIGQNDGVVFEGIGVSLPGRVDRERNKLMYAPNLDWREIDFRTPLERATGVSVEIENAANACALSEIYFGKHADGTENLIAVTVSEGIGTGIITNGQLMRGPNGTAGEFGHVCIDPRGPHCNCGNSGCWEVFASNRAAVRYYLESLARKGRGGAKSDESVRFEDVTRLAAAGDAKAKAAINKMAEYLGQGIAMLVTGFSPGIIVVVGEVTTVWDLVEPVIQSVVGDRAIKPLDTAILSSDEATQPRLRGTIALVMEKNFGAPAVA